jgi:hypothetical protein
MHEGHTTPTKENHTVCYLDGVPTFFCFHESCKEWMEQASAHLRSKLDFRTPEEKTEGKIKAAQRQQLKYDVLQLRRDLERIYTKFMWGEIFADPKDAMESFSAFLRLWKPHVVIWMGDVWDTGEEQGSAHFKTVEDWYRVHDQLFRK